MCIRRPRSHLVGISNIDYRSKRDEENLKIFEPWQVPKDFGTMGYRNYRNSPKLKKEIFSPTQRINTQKDLVNDFPDPRFYATARFYKDNNINLKIKSFLNLDRISNLEETYKGKDVFIGDGMGITDTIKKRKGKKDKKIQIKIEFTNLLKEEHKQQINKTEKLVKEKKKINKDTILETQVTKIDTNKTENNLIDMNKIMEIRQAIRRRYGNRKKSNKIFQQWAKTFPNKITVYDAYKMINSLNIPINYNETRALIASGSNFGNEYLNIEEFTNLIFNKNEELYESPWKSPRGGKNIFDEKDKNNLKKIIFENNKEIDDYNNIKILKDFISQRAMTLIKNFKEISREKYFFYNIENKEKNTNNKINYNKCNYEKFSQGILSLNPSKLFAKEKYIKSLFDEYKDKNDLVDIKYFINDLYEKNCKEYLTVMKDNISNKFKEEVYEKEKDYKKFLSENKNKKPLIYQKKYDLDKQLLLKKENELKEDNENNNRRLLTEINSTVPSTPWINHVYEKINEHYNSLNRVEQSLSAKPTMKRNILKNNTRFGANPKWRNTAEILIGDEFSSTYINEKDRFKLDRDIGKDDKIKNEKIKLGREKRIKTAIQKFEENNYIKQILKDEKYKRSQLEKSRKQYDYEDLFRKNNFLIE